MKVIITNNYHNHFEQSLKNNYLLIKNIKILINDYLNRS